MEQDRQPGRADNGSEEGVGSGDTEQQSASQRRAGSEPATRDYQRQMQELDSAGTVEEAHDRKAGGSVRERGESGAEPHDRLAGGSRLEAGAHDTARVASGRSGSDADPQPPRAGDGAMRPLPGPVGEEPRDAGGDAADGRPVQRAASDEAAEGQPEQRAADEAEEESRAGKWTRERMGRHAVTAGLAASSLALLAGAGARGGAGDPAVLAAADDDVFMPPAEVAEKKGVTWDLHMSDHERIDFFVEYLMGKNYDKTRTWLERIGKYGPLVQNELKERGMPQDLLFLTMIESGLDPNAYSKAHAAGLWQFIEETGKRYGLEVSTYVDERRDPVKATGAALTYLQEMHGRFDSWYLSAAGYNTGENRVGRLMRETTGSERGSDEGYWQIWERLPSETRDYVPLMLAMGKIAKEPEKYGFKDLQYQEPLKFEQVTVPGGTKLADVAKSAGVDPEVLYDLNPHLVKKQTPPKRAMAVRVPVGQGPQVASAFNTQVVEVGAPAE